jgi:transketolase
MPVEFGKGVILKNAGAEVTVMTAGPILPNVIDACDDLNVNIAYFHIIKSFDRKLVRQFAGTRIIVIHNAFGLYEAVCEIPGISASYHGIPDQFSSWYGTLEDIRAKLGLDKVSIRQRIEIELQQTKG